MCIRDRYTSFWSNFTEEITSDIGKTVIDISTTVITIKSCENDYCDQLVRTTGYQVVTTTIDETVTEFTTFCDIPSTTAEDQILSAASDLEGSTSSEVTTVYFKDDTTTYLISQTVTNTGISTITTYSYQENEDYVSTGTSKDIDQNEILSGELTITSTKSGDTKHSQDSSATQKFDYSNQLTPVTVVPQVSSTNVPEVYHVQSEGGGANTYKISFWSVILALVVVFEF